ncbi:rapid alkalinization factor [Populus alba]|uniref:RALF-LIKE 23 family protein n=3 Tax=Populus TaxID=3689 RepID=A0A4U5Q7T3_POPAL|nr:rapid alkalinization factor-like [Populus alba]KAJ6974273.1 rapid alkalinization factor-like [Populus alba x Populus x berolinensis]TKS04305.1 RALF-LIKE 23 family protein [Populus alba]
MARLSSFFLISATVLILMVMGLPSTVQGNGDHHHHLGWIPTTTTTRSSICDKGSLAECMAEEDGEEFGMDTEINRRILATSRYVSYGALQKNNVPCSRRGASYYNCKNGAQANPYTRGCSSITRCRG